MKKQILTFIVGVLVGAIITTGVFLILKGNKKSQNDGFNRENMPSMDGKFPGKDGNFPGGDGNFPGGERPSRNNKTNAPETTNGNDVGSNNVEE